MGGRLGEHESLLKKVAGRLGFKGEETVGQARDKELGRAFQAAGVYLKVKMCNSAQHF